MGKEKGKEWRGWMGGWGDGVAWVGGWVGGGTEVGEEGDYTPTAALSPQEHVWWVGLERS